MRLIDADAFKRQVAAAAIQNGSSAAADKAGAMINLIDVQPTISLNSGNSQGTKPTNREHFFGDKLISDTVMLLTYNNHRRKECRLFKQELGDMAMHGEQLKDWLDSPKDPRFNW